MNIRGSVVATFCAVATSGAPASASFETDPSRPVIPGSNIELALPATNQDGSTTTVISYKLEQYMKIVALEDEIARAHNISGTDPDSGYTSRVLGTCAGHIGEEYPLTPKECKAIFVRREIDGINQIIKIDDQATGQPREELADKERAIFIEEHAESAKSDGALVYITPELAVGIIGGSSLLGQFLIMAGIRRKQSSCEFIDSLVENYEPRGNSYPLLFVAGSILRTFKRLKTSINTNNYPEPEEQVIPVRVQ